MWKFNKSGNRKDSHPKRRVSRTRRERKILIWIERISLVTGLSLVVFYGAARIESSLSSRAALKQFAAAGAPSDSEANDRTDDSVTHDVIGTSDRLEIPRVDFDLWGEGRVAAYRRGAEKRSGIPLAVLRIPKIRLEVPLLEGTDELTLNHAVGRIAGTASPGEAGNVGIAGHRDGFFRGLKDVGVGDAIELKTLKATTTYTVDRIQIVSPDQVEVLRSTAVPSLTLVTCYPFYFFGSAPQRYVVTASLSPEKIGEAESSTLSTPANETNSTKEKTNETPQESKLYE